MAEQDKLRFLTGQESNLGSKAVTRGQVYFAINSDQNSGKIYFDAPADKVDSSGNLVTQTKRIVMNSDKADYATNAGHATSADIANKDIHQNIISETYVSEITLDKAGTTILYKYPDIQKWNELKPKFLPLTGGTITGELYVDGGTTLASLLVNGDARFVNTIQGNIETANKWKTACKFITNLGSENPASIDGSFAGPYNLGVTGTLPISHGGTGNAAFTANRIIYSETVTKLSSSSHYMSNSQVSINSSNAPTAGVTLNINGATTTSSYIKIDGSSGTTATTNYISLGRGYGTGSGKNGLKVLVCDQSDCQTGLGQDLCGYSYELSLATTANGSNGKITFGYNTASAWSTYTEMGHFSASDKSLTVVGNIIAPKFKGLADKANEDGSGNNIEDTYLKRDGMGVFNNWMTHALEIRNTSSASSMVWSGGAFHNGYVNLVLRGNDTTGISGIAFTSSKGATSINQPSDRAFIQYHPFGVTTLTEEGTDPTLATSGEKGILVIGVGNDVSTSSSGDSVYLQTCDWIGLKHNVANTVYTIPSMSATVATANYPLITTATAGVYTHNTNIAMNGGAVSINGTLSVSGTTTISGILTMNNKIVVNNQGDSTFSEDTSASIYTKGGISVEKQISAKSIRIDNNLSNMGCTVKFNSNSNCIEFVFD